MITMHKACSKHGHRSVTMAGTSVQPPNLVDLNALLVVCHKWGRPARLPVYQQRSCGRWPR